MAMAFTCILFMKDVFDNEPAILGYFTMSYELMIIIYM